MYNDCKGMRRSVSTPPPPPKKPLNQKIKALLKQKFFFNYMTIVTNRKVRKTSPNGRSLIMWKNKGNEFSLPELARMRRLF